MITLAFYIHGLRYVRRFDARHARPEAWAEARYWVRAGYQVDIKED